MYYHLITRVTEKNRFNNRMIFAITDVINWKERDIL